MQGISRRSDHFPAFTAADLTKLAYWMATGSGKTLLLHINYLQFLHYHAPGRRANRWTTSCSSRPTPASAISTWRSSPRAASRRSASAAAAAPASTATRSRCWRSPSSASEAAGHVPSTWTASRATTWSSWTRGTAAPAATSGCGLRDKVAAEGFTFEYSATFGEAFNGGNKPRTSPSARATARPSSSTTATSISTATATARITTSSTCPRATIRPMATCC